MSFIKKNLQLVLIILTGLTALSFCLPFVGWISFAAVLAFTIKPIQNKILIKKFHINKTLSVYIILSSLILVLSPFILSFLSFFSEGKEISKDISKSQIVRTLDVFVDKVYVTIPVADKLSSKSNSKKYLKRAIQRSVRPVLNFVSSFFMGLPMFFLGLFFFSASLFYFISDSNLFYNFVKSLDFISKDELSELVRITQKACQSTLYAALFTGFAQAAILSVTSLFLGLHFFFTIFFLTFFVAQIPLVGTFPISLGLFIHSYYHNNTVGMFIAVTAGVVAGLSDNVIRAWFLNRYDSLHPLAGLISTIGSLIIMGPIGVIIGPVITLVFIGLLEKYKTKAH